MNTEFLFLAVIIGWLIHIVADLAEASVTTGQPVRLMIHIKAHPWRLLLSALGTFAGLLLLYHGMVQQIDAGLYEMALGTAMGIGYAGDSVVGKLGSFAQRALDRNAP